MGDAKWLASVFDLGSDWVIERTGSVATPCSGHFQVAKHLLAALDKVRRAEHRQRQAEGDTALSRTCRKWLVGPGKMTHAERLVFARLGPGDDPVPLVGHPQRRAAAGDRQSGRSGSGRRSAVGTPTGTACASWAS